MRKQGVRVRILTNALEATNVAIVHSGYAKYRKPLLEHGVELYEIRGQAPDYASETLRQQLMNLGSSGGSLHVKPSRLMANVHFWAHLTLTLAPCTSIPRSV